MSLPGHFHDEANAQTCAGIGAAEAVNNIESLVAQLLNGFLFQAVPYLGSDGFVVVLIVVGSPPHGVLGNVVAHQIFVFRRTACINAGKDVDRTVGGKDATLVAFQLRVQLVAVQVVVAWIVDDVFDIFDAILRQIYLCHSLI